jgi:hypothetical protein
MATPAFLGPTSHLHGPLPDSRPDRIILTGPRAPETRTIAVYLPHRAPFFEKAFDRSPAQSTSFVSDFHQELLVKLDRMDKLQTEFAAAAWAEGRSGMTAKGDRDNRS